MFFVFAFCLHDDRLSINRIIKQKLTSDPSDAMEMLLKMVIDNNYGVTEGASNVDSDIFRKERLYTK